MRVTATDLSDGIVVMMLWNSSAEAANGTNRESCLKMMTLEVDVAENGTFTSVCTREGEMSVMVA
jgi:hypothetical protein